MPTVQSTQTNQSELPTNQDLEKELMAWSAPARPFKRRNRDFYVTLVAIAGVFGLILFFAEGVLPVVLIISIVFLFYILSTVEPETIGYKVTTKGIKVIDKLTAWETMGRFWFTKRFDSQILVVETSGFPGRLELVVNRQDKDRLEKILAKYLVHEQIPASTLDMAANWFSKRLPGNEN